MLAPPCAMILDGGPSRPKQCEGAMGAMRNWAMVCEELHAAREHWEQCNHANMAATRAELEAHIRLERAQAEHQREIRSWIASQSAQEGPKDAPGTPTGGECEETCAECGRPVSEADWDGEDECVHPECEPERRQALAEYAAECRAEASLMFGEGRGSL